jgi:hypothetical protein
MAITRPFSYNTGAPIAGTIQVGSLAVGTPTSGFTNNPTFWNGPDEELGYVIAVPVSGNTQPTPVTTNRVYLSPTYKGTDIQLSNNNQTASQLFGYQQSVLGVNPIGTTDKVMFSVLCTLADPGAAPDSHFVGVGTTSMNYSGNPYGGFPGNDNQSVGFNSGGEIWFNGTAVDDGWGTWGDGDIVDVAVDKNVNKLWVRENGGFWNGNISSDPSTNTNGFDISGITGTIYPVLCPSYQGTMIVQNSPAYSVPSGYNFLATLASVAFYGTKNMSNPLSESTFVELTNSSFNQSFTTGNDASTWLTNNGYWNSWVSITPTPTATLGVTPTPTPSVTNTQTPSVTPTLTPTPSTSPVPVTGYGYNLVVLPYQAPTSGNTIFPTFATPGSMTGTTNPNTFNVNGIYWNAVDNSSVDRTSYYSGMTGVSVTAYFTQNGDTAIYSGSPTAFTVEGPPGQESFNYNPGSVPNQLVLIQSASTNFVTGQTVYISYVVNGAGVTPTPTATSVTPTPTPTSGASGNFNVTISQVGSDVVWNGSGSFNLAALASIGTATTGGGFNAGSAAWAIGPTVSVDSYSGVTTYPSTFGTGGVAVTSNAGSTFGILLGGSGRLLYVPTGYTSNTVISGSSTYANKTIAGMNLTPGVYTWSWGTGGNTSTLVMTISS